MWTGGVRVIMLDDSNRVLMVRQHHEGRDIWMVPGGTIEDGETAAEAGAREVLEETGLQVTIGRLVWHVEQVSDEKGQRFVNFFLGEITGGGLRLGSDPELGENSQVLREVRFMPREEIRRLDSLYPACLREELWQFLEGDYAEYNAYKTRE